MMHAPTCDATNAMNATFTVRHCHFNAFNNTYYLLLTTYYLLCTTCLCHTGHFSLLIDENCERNVYREASTHCFSFHEWYSMSYSNISRIVNVAKVCNARETASVSKIRSELVVQLFFFLKFPLRFPRAYLRLFFGIWSLNFVLHCSLLLFLNFPEWLYSKLHIGHLHFVELFYRTLLRLLLKND